MTPFCVSPSPPLTPFPPPSLRSPGPIHRRMCTLPPVLSLCLAAHPFPPIQTHHPSPSVGYHCFLACRAQQASTHPPQTPKPQQAPAREEDSSAPHVDHERRPQGHEAPAAARAPQEEDGGGDQAIEVCVLVVWVGGWVGGCLGGGGTATGASWVWWREGMCCVSGGGGQRRRRKTRQPASASNFFPSTHPNPPTHPPTPTRWTILKGDKVEVINGPEKGKQGTVLKVLRDQNRVVIEGVNVRRRTQKPTPNGNPGRSHPLPLPIHPPTYLSMVYSSTSNPPPHPPTPPPTHRSSFHPPTHPPLPGKIVTYPAALNVSNVNLIDPESNQPTKVSRRFLEDGTRVRVAKKSG